MLSGEHSWVKSSCEECFNDCGILVEVKDGKAIRIVGDPQDIQTKGKICPRGMTGLRKLYDPYRVKAPLIRTNPEKGIGVDPKWREISWEEALDLVGEKLKKIRKDNPNKLVYVNWPYERYFQANKFGHAFGTKNSGFVFSGISNRCGNPIHLIGLLAHGAVVEFPDLDYTNYLILWGTQLGYGTYQQNLYLATKMADARARGMKLVVVDPTLSRAAGKADWWLPIRPGTDLALLLSMIQLLLHEYKIYDSDFLKQYTNAPYLLDSSGNYVADVKRGKPMIWDAKEEATKPFDDLSIGDFALEGRFKVGDVQCVPAFQLLKDHMAKYTPGWASKITSIPEEQIRRLTREFAEAAEIGAKVTIDGCEYPLRPVAMATFKGGLGHTNGGQAAMAQEVLLTLLGALGAVGGQLSKSVDTRRYGGEPQLLGVGERGIVQPHGIWEIRTPFAFPPERVDLGEYFPVAYDMGQLAPLVTLDPKKYGLAYEPEVLLVYQANPLKDCGDLNIMTQALKKFSLVVDITIYLDETCDFADVVLPDHCYLERYHLLNFTHDMVGLRIAQPVVEPRYNTMNGMDILIELAERAECLYGEGGFNDALNRLMGLRGPFILDLKRKYTWKDILDVQAKCYSNGERDIEWYKQHGSYMRSMKAEEKYRIYKNGRIPIYYDYIKRAGDELKENLNRYNVEEKVEFNLDLLNLRQYSAVPYWEPTPLLEDPEYDLYLIFRQSFLTTYSEGACNPFTMEIAENDPYELTVAINEQTAKRKGISNGDDVWIESRIAKGKAQARLTQGTHPEVIAVSAGYGRWLNHPVAKGKGFNLNEHSILDFQHSGALGGQLEGSVRVRISKV